MRQRLTALWLASLLLLAMGCASQPAEEAAEEGQQETEAAQSASSSPQVQRRSSTPPPAARTITVPEGTVLTVRLNQAVGSKISETGETFSATVAEPVEVNGAVAIPAGADAEGTVVEAAPLGRFKGGAKLQLILHAVTINGQRYRIDTASVQQTKKGKGKRTATMIGGGAGAGALIGGITGGGKGAAIGAAIGAGAGTAGAAYTGNKNIVFPAETALSFSMLEPVEIKQ